MPGHNSLALFLSSRRKARWGLGTRWVYAWKQEMLLVIAMKFLCSLLAGGLYACMWHLSLLSICTHSHSTHLPAPLAL